MKMSTKELEAELKDLSPRLPRPELVQSITSGLEDETCPTRPNVIIRFLPLAAAACIGFLGGTLLWNAVFKGKENTAISNIALQEKSINLQNDVSPTIKAWLLDMEGNASAHDLLKEPTRGLGYHYMSESILNAPHNESPINAAVPHEGIFQVKLKQ